jgi:acyl-CoA thioesterase
MSEDQKPAIVKERYKNSFENFLGVEFKEYKDGYCEIALQIKPEHLNIGNAVHGGIINSLCDIALSGAVTSNFPTGAEAIVTMQMNVNFLKPGKNDDHLTAFGKVLKAGKTICYVEGGVRNREDELIAKADGNWFIKRKP